MRVLILDDDKRISNFIKSLLEKYFSTAFTDIEIVNSLDEAIHALNKNTYELLLFDIDLGNNKTSFDALDKIKKGNNNLIFITGHENYALEAIKAGVIDYILKPINIQEFKIAIEKAIKKINDAFNRRTTNHFIKKQDDRLMLKDLESMRLVTLSNIIYLEASGAYTYIYLECDEKITVTKHLKDFENRLDKTGFYRIHNSFIINTLKMNGITRKDGLAVNMTNGKCITISSRRKDEFMKFIETYLQI